MSADGVKFRKRIDKLIKLDKAFDKTRKNLRDKIVKLFPIGTDVRWMHGKHEQWGQVVDHGTDRLKVENYTTERQVWITYHDMIYVYGVPE